VRGSPARGGRRLRRLGPAFDAVDEFGFDRVAEPFGRVDERDMSGLVGRQPLVFDDSEIVLHHTVGDDDVTDMESLIQSARNSGENYCVATESVGQQRCHQPAVHLAHAGCGQHHRVRVEFAGIEGDVCNLFVVAPDSALRRYAQSCGSAQMTPIVTAIRSGGARLP
jgi:hypothetical protein